MNEGFTISAPCQLPLAGMLVLPTPCAFMRAYPEITSISISPTGSSMYDEGFDGVVRAGEVTILG